MIGIDICQVDRIKKIQKNLEKIFHSEEIQYFKKHKNNPQIIAGHYSAKEAIMKAFSCCKNIVFLDILIYHNENGKPLVKLFNLPKKEFEENSYKLVEISISHEKDYACAVAQIIKEWLIAYE